MMKRLAIIGAGSSGLITLKTALDHLENWEIVCFEKSGSIQGCWGNPYPDFISTSTKYTTQFSCFKRFDESTDSSHQYGEFFKGDEYGKYLEEFADHFHLRPYIQLNTHVKRVEKTGNHWQVAGNGSKEFGETFSHVIVCTGLTEKPKGIQAHVPTIQSISEVANIEGKTVVVMGGGESAADLANRLSAPEKNNQVYLSLKAGIRVSPRYHPIKGVPSDFLRNRLMLSISQNLRNKIGQKFVESRIKYQKAFTKLFPNKSKVESDPISSRRKEWDLRLTSAAKDNLFNMFHNKSDGFLDAVGEDRIKIIGEPLNDDYQRYNHFQSSEEINISPDLLLPATGYKSALSSLFNNEVNVRDFYLGCTHYKFNDLFLIGFARPIIGNIPSISEQQALYTIKCITKEIARSQDIEKLHIEERAKIKKTYPKLNIEAIYPVEMFPYCDQLSRAIGTYPKQNKISAWFKTQLSPATTLHYSNYQKTNLERIYTPPILNALLLMIKLLDSILSKITSLK